MSIKDRLRRCIRHNRFILFGRLLCEAVREAYDLSCHLGASQMLRDEVKFAADLQIRVHAIEKGLSLGSCRPGFGQPKVVALLEDLSLYITRFKDANIDEAVGVITQYIAYNRSHGVDLTSIVALYDRLLQAYKLCHNLQVGIEMKERNHTLEAAGASFEQFSASRYSVRDFDPCGVVEMQDILSAIDIARKAPSACNRQPACAHIYTGEKAQALFDFQGGCKGFSQDMQYAILVTADMRRYFIQERHQVYVDGGLFAMELLLSLHHKGLATIPLTTAFKGGVTRRMKRTFDIPANEVPIVLIGVGAYKESYKVAVSLRNSVETYYKMHD